MAVNPVLVKAAVKVAISVAADEETRRKLLIIILIPIIAVLLVLSMFYYILTQPFAWLTNIFSGSNDKAQIEQFRTEKGYIIQGNLLCDKKFPLPFKGDYKISSPYGMRKHPATGEIKKHTGIDLVPAHHSEILAIADGDVVSASLDGGYGNYVEIKHIIGAGKVIYSFYAHLSMIDVKIGDKVTAQQKIGIEGGEPDVDDGAGLSTGHHLHFEMRKAEGKGNDVDPYPYLFDK